MKKDGNKFVLRYKVDKENEEEKEKGISTHHCILPHSVNIVE